MAKPALPAWTPRSAIAIYAGLVSKPATYISPHQPGRGKRFPCVKKRNTTFI